MGKKPKLTKAERVARKKARREAARLRRIQAEIQAKKDHLDRETKATEMNSVAIKTKWRDIMRRLRAPQLYDDFVALRLRTERLMDMKSAMIDELREALDQANDQHDVNLQHHVEVVDRMLDFFHSQMEAASEWYRRTLGAMGEGLAGEKGSIQARLDHDQGHLEVILFAMQERRHDAEVQRYADITAKLDEETVKHAEQFQVMQTRLETAVEQTWAALSLTLEDHQRRHAERRAAVARLAAKEQAEHRVIAEQRRRTRLLHRQIEEGLELMRAWDTSDPGSSAMDRRDELRALRHERDEFRAAYLALRDAMDGHRQHDRRQLSHMVVLAEDSVKRLQEIATCGEKILALSCICNTLETDDERLAYPEDDNEGDEREEAYWVRGRVDRRSPTEVLEALELDNPKSPDDAPPPAREGSHTCFTNVDEDLAAELGVDADEDPLAFTEDVTRPAKRDPAEEVAAGDSEEEKDFIEETVSCLGGLAGFWSRVGVADAEKQRLQDTLSQLRAENRHLQAELRGYLRCVAPTWVGAEPVPRGPASVPVYEPPPRPREPRGTNPWRGVRGIRAVGS